MKLGFVSAILPEQSLREVIEIASDIGYDCVELMCWPRGKSERRYAGITHLDVDDLDEKELRNISGLLAEKKIGISALGYYPNPLTGDQDASRQYVLHLKKVISAAAILNLKNVNTFVGRDHTKSIEDNWDRFLEIWKPIVGHAEKNNVFIGIENCPMLFTNDEWPGGKNLATSPAIWERMFEEMDSDHLGLNYDPSHMIWQHMDYLSPLQEFSSRLFHIHAKDVRIDQDQLDRHGIMATPNLWHTPKLPGMGDVHWGQFFSHLTSVGYNGAVCVEVEDRAYEGSLNRRIASLQQSHTYLRQFIPKANDYAS